MRKIKVRLRILLTVQGQLAQDEDLFHDLNKKGRYRYNSVLGRLPVGFLSIFFDWMSLFPRPRLRRQAIINRLASPCRPTLLDLTLQNSVRISAKGTQSGQKAYSTNSTGQWLELPRPSIPPRAVLINEEVVRANGSNGRGYPRTHVCNMYVSCLAKWGIVKRYASFCRTLFRASTPKAPDSQWPEKYFNPVRCPLNMYF